MPIGPRTDLQLIHYIEREVLSLIGTAPAEALRLVCLAVLLREATQ